MIWWVKLSTWTKSKKNYCKLFLFQKGSKIVRHAVIPRMIYLFEKYADNDDAIKHICTSCNILVHKEESKFDKYKLECHQKKQKLQKCYSHCQVSQVHLASFSFEQSPLSIASINILQKTLDSNNTDLSNYSSSF